MSDVQFKDFIPERTTRMLGYQYAPITELMPVINKWIADESVNVLNIETLFFSNLDVGGGTEDGKVDGRWINQEVVVQTIRVWFRGQ